MRNIDLCKKCKKSEFDSNKGIVCSLTSDKPTFEDGCPNFQEEVAKQRKPVSPTYPLALKIFFAVLVIWGLYKILSMMFVGLFVSFK